MPASSKKQRKAAGAALSAKRKGDCSSLPEGSASRDMCNTMSEAELEEFASGVQSGASRSSNTARRD